MDWLRSEDLNEEKSVTAPIAIIAVHALCRCQRVAGVPLVMSRFLPENLDPEISDRSVAADVLLRQEPDEEEDEEEDDRKEDDDDGDTDDGYSE